MSASQPLMSGLVLLDVAGVLCYKYFKSGKETPVTQPVKHTTLSGMSIIIRPGVQTMLKKLRKRYTVGFFSSTTTANGIQILRAILGDTYHTYPIIWFRDRTRLDPDYGNNPDIKSHDTVKCLADLLDNPVINKERKYGWHNTILCDDSAIKTRFNPPANIVIVPPYNGDVDDYLSMLPSIIDERMAQLSTDSVAQRNPRLKKSQDGY